MGTTDATRLRRLETCSRTFGPGAADKKLHLLAELAPACLDSAKQVLRFHEVLCFLRAYPDDERVLAAVEALLDRFETRRDLGLHRAELHDTGVVGTDLRLGFYAPMARWVVRHWPERLQLDWSEVHDHARLKERIYLLGLDAEAPGLDHASLTARQWVERMKGPDESDAAFLVRRFSNVPWKRYLQDTLLDELELPLVLRGGPGGPSRTSARARGGEVVWQTGPVRGSRPDLAKTLRRPPRAVRDASPSEGRGYIELARSCMVTRHRALDAFAGGDANDVRVVDCGEGLEFVLIGAQPAWRMLVETVYGWLTLKNRVPIGYVLSASMFGSSEIAYNVFETWRGAEAAHVYGRALATARHVFGSDTFTIYPYQLGHENAEGLRSGAWWFYQKLGFRPRDPEVDALMQEELQRMGEDPDHRSSLATLKKLARENLYYETGRRRRTVLGTFPLGRVGLGVTDTLARRFGSRRDRAERVCAEDAGRLLGCGDDWKRFPTAERKAWVRWGPLVCALPGVERWSAEDRARLVEVVRAKGGRRESDYLRLFDEHGPLRASLVRLTACIP